MIQIPNLSNSANQQVSILLADKTLVTLTLVFRPRIQRWTFNVSYNNNSKVANGFMLCTHPNILRAYRGTWPFGLAVTSTDGADPFRIDDFVSGRIVLFVLDNTAGVGDVDYVEANIF